MANCLTMDLVHNVVALKRLGWSDRRIARELRVHRETVARHVRSAWMGARAAGEELLSPQTGQDAPTGSSASQEASVGSSAAARPAREAPAGSRAATNLATGSADPPALPGAASRGDGDVLAMAEGGFNAMKGCLQCGSFLGG